MTHGTLSAYTNESCRCGLCREANTAYQCEYARTHQEAKRATRRKYYRTHREARSTAAREYQRSPKGQAFSRERHLQSYGLTPEQYAEMLVEQKGVCAVCGKPETAQSRLGTPYSLAVDHDHETGAVRGLLCGTCNAALGMLGDSSEMILNLLSYRMRFF